MTTSADTTPNETAKLDQIPNAEFSYICSRNQHQAHDLLVRAIKQSGRSQKELSQLTGIDEASISRLLRRPRNLELKTLSKILYAACGAALSISPAFPMGASDWVIQAYSERTERNNTEHPSVFYKDTPADSLGQKVIQISDFRSNNQNTDDVKFLEMANA